MIEEREKSDESQGSRSFKSFKPLGLFNVRRFEVEGIKHKDRSQSD